MNTSNESKRPSAEPCNLFAPDDIVRHVRSGHTYRVLGRCTIEATLADCYMYRCTDGHVWIRPVIEMEDGRFVLLTRELDAAQPAPKDREKDRERFSDPAFNRWLDEGISDAGHTVYDTVGDLSDAWAAWQAAAHYGAAQLAQAGEAILLAKYEALKGVLHDEIAANLAFREAGGALPDEDMPTFCARILAELDYHRTAAQVATVEYFAYSPDCGFDTFATADQARKAAQESIDGYRDDAPDGWNEEVANVCWGAIIGQAEEFGRRDATPDDGCMEGIKEWVDYRLSGDIHPQPEQPASDERLTVAEVATLLGRKGLDVLKALQRHGVMATLNQRIDFKDALLAASWVEQPASAVSPAAYCDASDPHSSTAFSWPGTAREPWHTTPLYLQAQSPAVSPPSVVAVAPKVAVSEEDVKAAKKAVEDVHRILHGHISNTPGVVTIRAALESFAQRIAGSGERDARLSDAGAKAIRAVAVGSVLTQEQWDGLCEFMREQDSIIRSQHAAIAQQTKRGGA